VAKSKSEVTQCITMPPEENQPMVTINMNRTFGEVWHLVPKMHSLFMVTQTLACSQKYFAPLKRQSNHLCFVLSGMLNPEVAAFYGLLLPSFMFIKSNCCYVCAVIDKLACIYDVAFTSSLELPYTIKRSGDVPSRDGLRAAKKSVSPPPILAAASSTAATVHRKKSASKGKLSGWLALLMASVLMMSSVV